MKPTKATANARVTQSESRLVKPGATPGHSSARPVEQAVDRKYFVIAACSAGILTLLVFINCLANGWVFDDYLHVLDPPELRSLNNVFSLLGHYRPLSGISYAFDFAIWGQSSAGFHFTNVALHSVNAVLAFLLVYRLIRDVPSALLASLLFALHPIQTDSVAYVSGRSDTLFSLFYLAAFYSYLSYQRRRSARMLAIGLISWVLSLMSKEMAASFPAVIFLWNLTGEFQNHEGPWLRRLLGSARTVLKRELWLYLGMTLIVIAYSYYDIVTQHASGGAGPGGFKYWGGGLYPNFLTELHVQGWLLKQLVWPTPIIQYSGAFPIATSIFDWKVVVSAIVVLAAIGAGLWNLKRHRLASFAILSYFAMLLPVSQIIPHRELIADHYLYLPIFSFALLVSLGAKLLFNVGPRARYAMYAGTGCILLLLGVLTIRQNAVWKDERSLWETNYAQVPTSPRAVFSLAGQYVSLNPRKARDLYHECLRLEPTYGQAYLTLAALVNNKEDARDVESLVETGLQIPDARLKSAPSANPALFHSQLKTALAMVKGSEGDQAAAEDLLWEAISADPTDPQPYELLSKIYAKDKDKQMDLFSKEIAAIPRSISAREGIVFLLIREQKFDEAIPYLNAVLSINPNDVFGNYQMGQIYRTKKDCPRARAYLKAAASSAVSTSDIKDVKDAMKQLVKDCGND